MNNIRHPNKISSPCPHCKKLASPDHRPFCSARCKDVDLNRWLGGAYTIAGQTNLMPNDGDDTDTPNI